MGEKSHCEVRFRHVTPREEGLPLMYLPMQQTIVPVDEPCGIEQAISAIVSDGYPPRREVRDVECRRLADAELTGLPSPGTI